jgi:hypothetical protein
MASIFKPIYAFYNHQYLLRPILTICVTNGFLAGISDTLTQKYLTLPTAEKVSYNVSETIDHVQSNTQESATKPVHTVDDATHKNTSVNSSASTIIERVTEKGDHVYQHIQDQLAHSDLVLHNKQTSTHDFARTGRFMFYNFSVAPIIHTWYTVLDKNFPVAAQAVNNEQNQKATAKIIHTLKPVLKRVAADQILFAPVGLAMLFTGLTLLEGGGVQQIKEKLDNVRFCSDR